MKNKTVKRVVSHLYLGPIKIYNEKREKKNLRGTLKLDDDITNIMRKILT